jgi:hypothetical protein
VINRRNGCGSTVEANTFKKGLHDDIFINAYQEFLLKFESNTENKKARV